MLPSISLIIMTLTFWLNLTTTVPRRQLEKSEEGTVQGKFQHVMGQQMPLGQSRISVGHFTGTRSLIISTNHSMRCDCLVERC